MQRLRKIFNISLCLIGFFVLIGNIVYAQQIPHFIKYQGDGKKILEEIEKGKKKKDKGKEKDLYTLTFRIYNIETGGTALWREIHLDVPIKKEKFEVLLGSFTPLDLRFDEDYWLSIEIDSKGEIKPRERMTSFAYAYMSEDSYKLGGRYADDFSLFGHSHIGEDVVSPVAEAINADTLDGLHADQIAGIKDHGLLEGLADDDHLQYLNILRGDERYAGTGWDGLTRLKTAQDHIADKNNPHAVTLEQLGHIDNNPEEEAPTATERGEPTGTEIQGWADDILSWGHSNLVANLNADKLDGKDSTEFSLIGHFHTLMDLTDVTSELRSAFLAAGTAGASGTNRLATMTDILATPPPLGLWTDEGTYIYPNNVGNGLQIMDTGHLAIAGNAGIIDAQTANPKGTLTVGQGVAGNNIDYSLVIARHGTPPNPGIYSHTAPALLIQDFSGTVPSLGRDKDGLLRINAYRIGDATPNAFNVTLFNVGNDEGEALRVDGLRNTFIGYGQKYPTSDQIGSLFVNGKVGIGTAAPRNLMQVKSSQPKETIVEVTNDDINAIIGFSASREGWAQSGFLQYYGPASVGGSGSELLTGDSVVIGSATGVTNGVRIIAANNGTHNAPIIFATGLWYAAAAERMRITSSGNVGIGTTNPWSPLHVANAKVSLTLQDIEHLGSDPGYGSSIRFTDSAGEPVAYLGDGGSSMLMQFRTMIPGYRLAFGSGQNYQLVLDPSGNVGINTANPGAALDVNGDLSVKGPIYQRGTVLHADYVFEPDYKLETIEEHNQFMWQEKHLKAVPKAAKTEDGQEIVEVGARGKGVLEELEKAHIYIAQLNERIKKLENK